MKNIKFVGPLAKAVSLDTGLVFVRDVPQPVTDEQAEKLLVNVQYQLVDDAKVAPDHNFVPTPAADDGRGPGSGPVAGGPVVKPGDQQ